MTLEAGTRLGPDQRSIGVMTILSGPTPRAADVRTLFRMEAPQLDTPSWGYARSSDRFLMLRPGAAKRDAAASVTIDWPALAEGK
ncbi:MAG TPA: hypothetical protein VMJ70_01115 [Candidatus Sulfotelmatobacter sp.]|nr:hypothetical protein [Candidatus Sulfotelmatobacter sp.]